MRCNIRVSSIYFWVPPGVPIFPRETYSVENVATNDTVFSNNRKSYCEIVNSTSIFSCSTGKIIIHLNIALKYYTSLQTVGLWLFPLWPQALRCNSLTEFALAIYKKILFWKYCTQSGIPGSDLILKVYRLNFIFDSVEVLYFHILASKQELQGGFY